MNATSTSFDNDSTRKSFSDYTLTPEGCNYMLSQFIQDRENVRAMHLKSHKALQMLRKLFKGKVTLQSINWHQTKECVLTYVTPYKIEADSLEEEVINFYYKNTSIGSRLIEIPYTSL